MPAFTQAYRNENESIKVTQQPNTSHKIKHSYGKMHPTPIALK